MEVLVLDGKNYVKASKAAKDLGYASDYVGQLCRSGQVDAHLIGRTWYVDQTQLSTHRVEKKRMSRVKARENAKKSIEEHRLRVQSTKNIYKNIDIQYESDNSALIPEVKRLDIISTQDTEVPVQETKERSDNFEVSNKGNKMVMSGEITVVDVTDGSFSTDTITLTPTRVKKGKEVKSETYLKEVSDNQEIEESTIVSIKNEKIDFKDRLIQHEVIKAGNTPIEVELSKTNRNIIQNRKKVVRYCSI